MSNDTLKHRLDALIPTLQQICKIAGIPGASIGVLHNRSILHKINIGYSNVEKQLPTASDTIYDIGSLTKAFTAATVARIVQDGLMSWETPIRKVLPGFTPQDFCLAQIAGLDDLLAHRTGLSPSISLSFQGDGDSLLAADQILPIVNSLKQVKPMRQEWIYNSWGYSVAGLVVEKLRPRSLAETVQAEILKPLDMTNTSLRPDFQDLGDQVAKPYAAQADGTPIELRNREEFVDSVFEAAAGMFSTIDDMLKWADMWLRGESYLIKSGDADSSMAGSNHLETAANGGGLDLRRSADSLQFDAILSPDQFNHLLSASIPIVQPSFHERSYTPGGWIRTQLRNTLGLMGDNAYIFDPSSLPSLGQGCPSELIFYHQGSTVGYFSCIMLIPRTHSAVVVLTNGFGLCDAADWMAQAVLQVLLDVPLENCVDFVQWSEKSASELVRRYDDMNKAIEAERDTEEISPYVPMEYTGVYVNELGNFTIEIRDVSTGPEPEQEKLELSFQGLETQCYELRYLYGDVWEWALTLDEVAARGRFHELSAEYFKIRFHTSSGEEGFQYDELIWIENPDYEPEGMVFRRRLSDD